MNEWQLGYGQNWRAKLSYDTDIFHLHIYDGPPKLLQRMPKALSFVSVLSRFSDTDTRIQMKVQTLLSSNEPISGRTCLAYFSNPEHTNVQNCRLIHWNAGGFLTHLISSRIFCVVKKPVG
ncbi:hypothetical protein M5D96_007866 [Drosophila gunungcola]|uniref:Uncharacterized protein n=1 Tax=Drosophila gunungcola TaxID=103775 RepID=A0A9P9YMG5_9MUSC|nr:hypothetical protein M5D96_007866 [Drosophila gunungcola]